tara:strand:- start:1783 stop:2061 length:279 start_codon:yes stop_codon:yes gene_type:complete
MTVNNKPRLRKIKEQKRVGKPFDDNRCFYINDFKKGDCLYVKTPSGREKGVVVGVDTDTMQVVFKNSSLEEEKVFLNDVVYLAPYQKDWLSN